MAKIDGQYLAQMEDILGLYALSYDPKRPVMCFDERPCFLIGQVVQGLGMQAGKVQKEHYAYQKNGACALLAAIEPLTGQRIAQVYKQRTAKEYTQFMQMMAKQYPEAEKIILIQDKLNTHKIGSFYQHLPAEEAKALADRFEFHYTPKSASWLNMIEIEFSALSKQCLDRRIPDEETLKKEIQAIIQERNEKQIKIQWQFDIKSARSTLNTKYTAVQENNSKYKLN